MIHHLILTPTLVILNQNEWKNLLYGESCDDKTFDDEKPKMKNVTDEPSIVSHDFSLLEGDSLSPSESSIEHHFFVKTKYSIQEYSMM